ncbi:MAG: hypothetical protein IJK02_03600 [Clostridia bacterium]|nr:hypothetical protein [Clostridia bacterium]
MKKSFTLFCSLLLLFTFLLPAAADVVWEPENDFYKEHLDECFEIHVTYVAQEAVAVVVSPEDHTPVKTIAPGETFYIGGQWGDYWRMLSDESGWLIPINCKRYYNASDFYSDHQDEITKLDKWESISLSDGLILWSFPGSGSYSEIIGMEDIGWDSETYNTIWKDDAGRT